MYCTNCGEEIENNTNFCTKCGSKLENNNTEGSITFSRINQFYGVLIPITIYLDGEKVASVDAGKEVKIPATIGKHRLAFNLWSGNGQYDIEITKEHTDIKVTFKLGMGLVTSKPKIISIENIS